MNSDRCHDEAQFQWLRYQLDSRVKLLPTLVAKWIECWKCVNSWRGDRLGIHIYTSDIYSFGVGLLSHNLQVVMAK